MIKYVNLSLSYERLGLNWNKFLSIFIRLKNANNVERCSYTIRYLYKDLILAKASVSLISTTLRASASLIHRNPAFSFYKCKNPTFN